MATHNMMRVVVARSGIDFGLLEEAKQLLDEVQYVCRLNFGNGTLTVCENRLYFRVPFSCPRLFL